MRKKFVEDVYPVLFAAFLRIPRCRAKFELRLAASFCSRSSMFDQVTYSCIEVESQLFRHLGFESLPP
jgi:hypothetical protein